MSLEQKVDFILRARGLEGVKTSIKEVSDMIKSLNEQGINVGGGRLAIDLGGQTNSIRQANTTMSSFWTTLNRATRVVYLAKQAFELMEKGMGPVIDTIHEFAEAITEIGGARNISQALVEAAKEEKSAATVRMTVSPNERASSKSLTDTAYSLSQRADLGAFTSSDWLSALNKIGTISGKQKTLIDNPQALEFIAKMAHTGGMKLEDMAGVYAQLVKQNPTLGTGDIQNILLSGKAIGQKGSFNVSELPEAHKLIEQAGQLGGNRANNLKELLGLGSILKPTAGSLQQAGTETQAFLRQVFRTVAQGQGGAVGLSKSDFDKSGHLINLDKAIENIVSKNAFSLPKPLLERESGSFIRNIGAAAGITDEMSETEKKVKVAELLNQYKSLTESMYELDQENKQVTVTQDQFAATFNELTDTLKSNFMPVLQELVPDLKDFSKGLGNATPDLTAAIKDLFEAIILGSPALITFAEALNWIAGNILVPLGATFVTLGAIVDKIVGAYTGDVWTDNSNKWDKAYDSLGHLAYATDDTNAALDKLKDKLIEIGNRHEPGTNGEPTNLGSGMNHYLNGPPPTEIPGHRTGGQNGAPDLNKEIADAVNPKMQEAADKLGQHVDRFGKAVDKLNEKGGHGPAPNNAGRDGTPITGRR